MNYAIKASTQEHLDVYMIVNDIIVLKDGSCAQVVQTNAINFDLLSEEEQEAIMFAYAGMLNSLSFYVQILVRSQRKDISSYLELLDDHIQNISSQKIKEATIRYRRFIKSLVKEKRVLEKQFYIIIPFTTLELGITASTFNPFAKRPNKPPYDINHIIEKAGMILNPRRDHIIHQLARIGLKSRQLNTQELINLFYHEYNTSSLQPYLPTARPSTTPQVVTDKPQTKVINPHKSIFNRSHNQVAPPATK